MNGTQVKAILGAFGKNAKLEIVATAQRLYHNYKGSHVAFNNDKELYTSVNVNADSNTFVKKPFEISCGSYDDISSIIGIGSYDETIAYLDAFVTAGIMTADDRKTMIEVMNKSGVAETYATATSIENTKDRLGTKPTMYDSLSYGNKGRIKIDEPKIAHKAVSTNGTVTDL